jgi:uncharacterized protein YutE (UPF0331/DUF86 family)
LVKPEVVRRKVGQATAWLDEAEAILSRSPEEFLAETKEHDLACYYLFLAIQECIDLAAHWLADAGWGPPDDAGSIFDVLAGRRAIDPGLAAGLRGAVGLRNRIAHGYAAVDHARVQRESREGIPTLRRFLAAAAKEAGL